MTAIVRNNFRVYNARKFISSLLPVSNVYSNSLYLGIGRPEPWSAIDDNPLPPGNNVLTESKDWADLMFMKRIFAQNISHCVPKRVWSANSLWDIYRADWNGYSTSPSNNSVTSDVNGEVPTDISQVPYYCSTSSNKVYVCLYNKKDNSGNIVPSTVNPDLGTTTVPGTVGAYTTPSTTGIKYCSDGYVWLEIGNSVDLVASFNTVDYYPVQTTTDTATGNSADQYTLQVNSASYKGGVYSVLVPRNQRGSGYNSGSSGDYEIKNPVAGTVAVDGSGTPLVKIIGDGSGLEYVVIFGSGGTLENIVITNPGSGYTWATVQIVAAGGTGAQATAILTPMYGIGVDPVKTLNAFNVMLNTTIYDDENDYSSSVDHGSDITTLSEYRKVCLVSNPKLQNGTLATINKLDMTYGLISATPPSGVNPGALLTHTNNKCVLRVVDSGTTSSAKGIVRCVQTDFDLPATGSNEDPTLATYNVSGGGTYVVNDSITLPDAAYGSGDIIYTDYRRPITRAVQQSETFLIVIEF